MAVVTKYVDPDAGGAGTGVDWANAYTSLEAWNNAQATDLTVDEDTHICNCRALSGTADSAYVEMDAWTCNATYYVKIVGDNTSGKRNTSAYRLEMDEDWNAAFQCNNCDYLVLENLQFSNTSGNQGYCCDILSSDHVTLIGCIAYDGNNEGFYINASQYVSLNNCVALNCTDGFHSHNSGGSDAESIYYGNCVAMGNSGNGFWLDDWRHAYYKNCYAGGSGGSDYAEDVNSTSNWTTSYSEDGTGTTTQAAYSTVAGAYFLNVTAGTEDPTITTDSALKDNGTDIEADADWVDGDVDIQDQARDANWDVGVYEVQAAAGGMAVQLATANLNARRRILGSGSNTGLPIL